MIKLLYASKCLAAAMFRSSAVLLLLLGVLSGCATPFGEPLNLNAPEQGALEKHQPVFAPPPGEPAFEIQLFRPWDEGLPPVPAPESARTIAGADVNSNGVRDDVERALARKYRGDRDAALLPALNQYAAARQMTLTAIDQRAAETAQAAVSTALACLITQVGLSAAEHYRAEIDGLMLDTRARLLRDSQYRDQIARVADSVLLNPSKLTCGGGNLAGR